MKNKTVFDVKKVLAVPVKKSLKLLSLSAFKMAIGINM